MYRDPILGDVTPTTMLKEEKKQETNKFSNMTIIPKQSQNKQKKISPKKTPHTLLSRFSKQLIPQGYGIKKESIKESINRQPQKVEQKEPMKQIQIIPKSQMPTLKKEQKNNKPQQSQFKIQNKYEQDENEDYTEQDSQQDYDDEEFDDDEEYDDDQEEQQEEQEDDQEYDEEPDDDDEEIIQNNRYNQKYTQNNKQYNQTNQRFKTEEQVYGRRPKQPMEIENNDDYQEDYQDDNWDDNYDDQNGDNDGDYEQNQPYQDDQYYDEEEEDENNQQEYDDDQNNNYDDQQNYTDEDKTREENKTGKQFEVKKPPFQISKGGLRMVTFELRKNDPTIPRDAGKITERDESGKYVATNIKNKLQALRKQAQEKTHQEEILKKQEDKFVPQFQFNKQKGENWTGYAFTDSMATGDDYKQVREQLLRGSDKFESTNGEFDISLFIRPHTRSNQGKDIKELRSYKGIMKCLHRLNEIVVNEEYSFLDVFEYAQDKYRAIKNDLLLVEASNDISHQLIGILELIARFYLYSYFKLIKYEWPEEFVDQKTYDRAKTNLVEVKKKINSTLSRIVQIYQDLQYDQDLSWSQNFPEFLQYQYLSFLTILPNTNNEIPHVQQVKLYEFIAVINQFKYGEQFYNTNEYKFIQQFQEYSIGNNLERLKNMFQQNINFYQSLFLLLQINQDKYKEINKKNVYIQRGETEEDQDLIRAQSLEKFQQETRNIYKLIQNTHLTSKQAIDQILNKRGEFKLSYYEDFQKQPELELQVDDQLEEGEIVDVLEQPVIVKQPSIQIIRKQSFKQQQISKPNNDRFIKLVDEYEKQSLVQFFIQFKQSKEDEDKQFTEYFIQQRVFRGLVKQFRKKQKFNFNFELGQKISQFCSDSMVIFKIVFYGDRVQLKKISNFLTNGHSFQEFYHQDKQIFIIASLEDDTGVDMYVQVIEDNSQLLILDKPSLIVRNREDQQYPNEVDLKMIKQRESLFYYKPFINAVKIVLDAAVRQKVPLPSFELLTFKEFCSQIQQAYKIFIQFNDKFETFARMCIFTEMCFQLLAQEHVKMNIIPNEVVKRTIGAERIIQQLNPNVGLLQKIKGKDILSGLNEYVGDVTQYKHLLQTFPTSKSWIKLWDQLLFDLGSLPITFIISKQFNINIDIQQYEGRVRSQLIFDFDLYDWIQKKVCS